MSSSAKARTQPESAPKQPGQLHFYRIRDDLSRAYQPVTDEERLLLTQMVRAWVRLERLYEAENEILDQHSLVDLFNNDPDRYKLLGRSIAEGERMWRNALQEFQRARRRRLGRNAHDLPAAAQVPRPSTGPYRAASPQLCPPADPATALAPAGLHPADPTSPIGTPPSPIESNLARTSPDALRANHVLPQPLEYAPRSTPCRTNGNLTPTSPVQYY